MHEASLWFMMVVRDRTTARVFSLRMNAATAQMASSCVHDLGFSVDSLKQIETPHNDWRRGGVHGSCRTRDAIGSGDFKTMQACLKLDAYPLDRHFLLQHLVNATFRDQNPRNRGKPKRLTPLSEEKARDFCEAAAWQWLLEWPFIEDAFRQQGWSIPHITVLKRLIGVLKQRGEKVRAAEVAVINARIEALST